MKKINFLFFFILISELCFGQIDRTPKALYIVKSSNGLSTATVNAFIDISQKDSIYALNDDNQTKEVCRLLNVDRIIVIKLKPMAKLLTMDEIFETYYIPKKHKRYSIAVNNQLINFPESILISKSIISEVKIVKDSRIEITEVGYYKSKKKVEDNIKKGGIYIK